MDWIVADFEPGIDGDCTSVGQEIMAEQKGVRAALMAPLVASSLLLLGGCMSSPTYGTGKSANEQLVEDVTGILSLGPKNKEQIAYKPRPELVTPADKKSLPQPQQASANAQNPAWPESPEARRARIRAEATANQDNPFYDSPVVSDIGTPSSGTGRKPGESQHALESGVNDRIDTRKQREAFNKRLAETKQGSETKRKYLSEPPLDYRKPAESVAVGDIGEDELVKERRRKAEARKKSGSTGWFDWLPGA